MEGARLEELRLSALEERIEADLALGRHAHLAGELQALVARDPLRERLRAEQELAPRITLGNAPTAASAS